MALNFFGSADFDFPKEVDINGVNYSIEVGFFKKKNSSVSVKNNSCLNFRLSSYVGKRAAKSHFEDLLEKIVVKLKKNSYIQIKNKTFEDVLNEGKFNFSEEIYYFEYTNKVRSVKLIENTFYLNTHIKLENAEKYVLKFLIDRYKSRLREYLFLLNSQTYNYLITDFELKLVKSKWGHCSHDNQIMLNLRLLNASKEVLDYVIYHELAHIRVKNHSPRFWDEVSRFCPNHKEIRKKLRNNPPGVFG